MHIDFFQALDLQWPQLKILYNEATRQRAINAVMFGLCMHGDKDRIIAKCLRGHGQYTEGFTEQQHEALKKAFKK